MERVEIMEKLRDILRMLGSCEEEVIGSCTEETNLETDLGLASVGMLYVVIAMEETFSVRFDDVAFSDFRTVGDVISYLAERV